MLDEWVTYQIYRSTILKQGQIKSETMSSYDSALNSYHIDRRLSLGASETPRIVLIIKSEKRFFPKQKATYLPITKDIMEKITENNSVIFDELNIDTAFKVAWAGSLRLGEIMYTGTKLKEF